jgi:hypothetical protein
VGQVANLSDSSRQVDNLSHNNNNRSPRERIMHTFKLFTARQCNQLLGRCGVFWQDESYDHCVRDEDELERIIQYVECNPVKAELADAPNNWPYSSASARRKQGLLLGTPIISR